MGETKQKTSKVETFKKRITSLSDVWEELDFVQRRGIIQSVIDRIVLTMNKCEIFYSFER
jgi:hypothetical protein